MVASADLIAVPLFLASSVATIAHRFIGLPRVSAAWTREAKGRTV
jgi:hypothetical protein